MGKQELPHYKQKQSLLFDENTDPKTLSQYAQRFFEDGWLSDAISFFLKAQDQEGLQQVRQRATEEGDAFLFKRTLEATTTAADPQEWKRLGDRAKELGKLQFAREAYRLAGNRKAMDIIDQLIRPQLEQELEESGDTDSDPSAS